jgi:methylenetetrahydrofolate dehydrogenase (NADP+)/methenyltetrahydrofolate cyclohydrolase
MDFASQNKEEYMETLKGLPVANAINEKIIEEMKDWKGAIPHLAIVRVGERPDDMSYERGATKKMEKVGFRCTSYTFPADIDNDSFQKEFDRINEDEDIDGILLLRPLPKHLDEKAIENRIGRNITYESCKGICRGSDRIWSMYSRSCN